MKHLIKSVLALALVSLMCVSVFGEIRMNASEWAKEDIRQAVMAGVMPEAMATRATQNLNREELVVLATNFYTLYTGEKPAAQGKSPYADTSSPLIVAAYELGLIGTFEDGMFGRASTVTREELAMTMYNAIKASGIDMRSSKGSGITFNDKEEFSDSFREVADFLAGYSIIRGIDGSYLPKQIVTVEQAVTAFYKAHTVFMRQSVTVNGVVIEMGQDKETLFQNLGTPNREDITTQGFTRYVYNSDPKALLMVGVKEGKVVDVLTSSQSFQYKEISAGTEVANLKGITRDEEKRLTATMEDQYLNVRVFYDTVKEKTVDAIYLADKNADVQNIRYYDKDLERDMALEVFDLVNSLRAKNGIPLLKWSDNAAASAKNHAKDMAENKYLDYNNKDGKTPFERMKEAGVPFTQAAETITRVFGDACDVYADSISNVGKRSNILNGKLKSAGVGVDFNDLEVFATIDLFK